MEVEEAEDGGGGAEHGDEELPATHAQCYTLQYVSCSSKAPFECALVPFTFQAPVVLELKHVASHAYLLRLTEPEWGVVG